MIFHRCQGPKLYGFFNSKEFGIGSVEQFIDGHCLTPQDAADTEISKEFAQKLAQVHSMQGLPLKKNSTELTLNQLHDFALKFSENKNGFLRHPTLMSADAKDRKIFQIFDFPKETKFVEKIFSRASMRKNVILCDLNYLNCMVRDGNKIAKDESRLVLIDFDAAQINFRGLDFGSHFSERVIDTRVNGNIAPDAKCPTKEEKIVFLKNYQSELKRLHAFPDFDENGVDSIENLLQESTIGMLHYILFFLGFMLAQFELFLRAEDNNLPVMKLFLKEYYAIKETLIADGFNCDN